MLLAYQPESGFGTLSIFGIGKQKLENSIQQASFGTLSIFGIGKLDF